MSRIVNLEKTDLNVLPFLKWVGGKRWLIAKCDNIFPEKYNNYIEPFLGGGSIFFYKKPNKSILSDINKELIETYKTIKESPSKVIKALENHNKRHSKKYYYVQRMIIPKNQVEKAARFIYLNRTCWNGLYRVNKEGRFNVPIGTRTNVILNTDNFYAVSSLLEDAQLLCSDFESTIDMSKKGDLIFVDPPYTVSHNNNGFLKYNEKIFSWDDQLRLRDALIRAKKRGSYILVLNANTPSIKKEYKNVGQSEAISRLSMLSGIASHRKEVTELLIKSW